MRQAISALLAGIIFGAGLAIAAMVNPFKIQDFLDVAGHWDATLLFVLGGAVIVTFVGYRLVFARGRPWLATSFELPSKRSLDVPLLLGSALFGVGWGMAGYCPGPGLAVLGTGRIEAIIFVGAMVAGILITDRIHALRSGTLTEEEVVDG
jgi:hypothetical protein